MFQKKLAKVLLQPPFSLKRGERLLVAVSGGPDSMALLHALHQISESYDWDLSAIHVNHQLRGEESDQDEYYVRQFCEQRGIELEVCRVDVNEAKKKWRTGIEESARRLRYEVFRKFALKKRGKILLAHHADDQVETILWNIIRGTGSTGLRGMKQVRNEDGVWYLRPLLSFDRAEIEKYCEQEKMNPRIDSSNFSKQFTRNRIRLELIPLLSEFNPRFKEGMIELSEVIREEDKYLQQLEREAYHHTVRITVNGDYELDIKRFNQLSVALQRRVVKLILGYLCKQEGRSIHSFQAIERVRNLAQESHPSKEIMLGEGIVARRVYQKLQLVKRFHMAPIVPVELSVPGEREFSLGTIRAYISEQLHMPTDKNTAVFDWEQLREGVLRIRSRRDGDRISFLGRMGSKKVKEVLIEEKVPKSLRSSYPLITIDQEILWLPGLRRSGLAPVSEMTRSFLYLVWEPAELWERICTYR